MFCLVSFDLLLNVMVGQRARWKKGFTRPGLFLLQLLKRSKRGGGREHAVLVVVCGRWPHFHIGESHSFFLCWNNYVPLDCDLKGVEPMFWSFLNACITCESRFKRIAGFGLDKVAFWDLSFFFFSLMSGKIEFEVAITTMH
jgi:hypothetical protein